METSFRLFYQFLCHSTQYILEDWVSQDWKSEDWFLAFQKFHLTFWLELLAFKNNSSVFESIVTSPRFLGSKWTHWMVGIMFFGLRVWPPVGPPWGCNLLEDRPQLPLELVSVRVNEDPGHQLPLEFPSSASCRVFCSLLPSWAPLPLIPTLPFDIFPVAQLQASFHDWLKDTLWAGPPGCFP